MKQIEFINTAHEKELLDLISGKLEQDATKEMFNQFINTIYQRGRVDMAKELSPRVKARHGIFTRDRQEGINYINKLVEDKVIVEKRESHHTYSITTIDSEYKMYSFNDSSRGVKIHYAHVDSNLLNDTQDKEIIECVIKPALIIAYQMYSEGEEYNTNDHLIYF